MKCSKRFEKYRFLKALFKRTFLGNCEERFLKNSTPTVCVVN